MFKSFRQGSEYLAGSSIKVLGRESGELSGLADQESTQRDHLRPNNAERQPLTEVVKNGSYVAVANSDGELLTHALGKRFGKGDYIHHYLGEERALVSVVVVDSALRDAGERRNILHGSARIPLAQE